MLISQFLDWLFPDDPIDPLAGYLTGQDDADEPDDELAGDHDGWNDPPRWSAIARDTLEALAWWPIAFGCAVGLLAVADRLRMPLPVLAIGLAALLLPTVVFVGLPAREQRLRGGAR